MMPPFVVFPTNRIAHFVEVSLYLFYLAQQVNLSGAKSSKVNGSTPNVTRWKKNGKYIDICGSKNIGKIISYGRQ